MKKLLAVMLMSTMLVGCACQDRATGESCAGKSCKAAKCAALKNSHFAFDSSVLSASDKANLDKVADRLNKNPKEKVSVAGYTDSTGPDAYNMSLSQRRANAVVAYLKGKGVAANRITAKGYGETNFVADNATEDGRAQNRRAEVSFK